MLSVAHLEALTLKKSVWSEEKTAKHIRQRFDISVLNDIFDLTQYRQ